MSSSSNNNPVGAGDRAAAHLLTFFAASASTDSPHKTSESAVARKLDQRSDQRIRTQMEKSKTYFGAETIPSKPPNPSADIIHQQQRNHFTTRIKRKLEVGNGEDNRRKERTLKKGKYGVKEMRKAGDPRPKRPMSAYNYFFQSERTVVCGCVEEASKIIGKRWRELSVEDRQHYINLAESDGKRYRVELAEYLRKNEAQHRIPDSKVLENSPGYSAPSDISKSQSHRNANPLQKVSDCWNLESFGRKKAIQEACSGAVRGVYPEAPATPNNTGIIRSHGRPYLSEPTKMLNDVTLLCSDQIHSRKSNARSPQVLHDARVATNVDLASISVMPSHQPSFPSAVCGAPISAPQNVANNIFAHFLINDSNPPVNTQE